MTSTAIEPPEGVPEEVAEALTRCTDRQLAGVISYAEQLRRAKPPLSAAIEAREREELVRVEERRGYTVVIMARPDGNGVERGSFAYRVDWEPNIDHEGGEYRWRFLGKVHGDTGVEEND